jgi:cytochrome c oxidase assembly protein subunit 15
MPFPIYALVVLGVNLFVILWGAVVRASGSGAGCGEHWPLCNGAILPQSHATATLIEFTHRATSGIALLLVIGLFWWSRRTFPTGHRARTGALWSLVFICSEALVGAGLVLLHLVGDNASPLRAMYLAAHLLNTFLLLAALALTAHWATHDAPWRRPKAGAAPWLLATGLREWPSGR